MSGLFSRKDQAGARKLVSAFLFAVCALTTHLFIAPETRAQSDSLTDTVKPLRKGMIGERDILITIVSDTIYLADTLAKTLLVTIDAQGTDISGFDFTFAYDMSSVEIYDAAPGDFLDSCDWEYFMVRRNPRCEGPCPNGLIKVLALAEFQKFDRQQPCSAPAPGASLVKLLARPTGSAPGLNSGSIRFFWIDCGDNSISSVSGGELFISLSAADSASNRETEENEFPNYIGPIPDCSSKSTLNPPLRKIHFRNGTLTLMNESPGQDSLR